MQPIPKRCSRFTTTGSRWAPSLEEVNRKDWRRELSPARSGVESYLNVVGSTSRQRENALDAQRPKDDTSQFQFLTVLSIQHHSSQAPQVSLSRSDGLICQIAQSVRTRQGCRDIVPTAVQFQRMLRMVGQKQIPPALVSFDW